MENLEQSKDNGANAHKASQPTGSAHAYPQDKVAVIGMACRFPDSRTPKEFWKLISSGGKARGRIVPSTRFQTESVPGRGPSSKELNYWGTYLDDVDAFDHRFFGISGREAQYMDPQQRISLQVAYEALESCGQFGPFSTTRGRREGHDENEFGCYMGVQSVDYEHNVGSVDATAFSGVGTIRTFISGRISHFLGWRGPALTIDTACSASAVAIHTACRALLSGEVSMALAGGVNVITEPHLFQNLFSAGFLSGRTEMSGAFDATASGYVRGEGVGMLVLKTLSQARLDGDEVLAVISGSAVLQGLNTSPITVPDAASLEAVYRKALARAGVTPLEVDFVEAHGPGTRVGDPAEYQAIRQTFSTGAGREVDLMVGSVKDNIGHTEAASGVASVIKAILMMRHEEIPPQVGFRRLNPLIQVSEMDRISIPTRSIPWSSQRQTGRCRFALINNYGASGNYTAIVVEEEPRKSATHFPVREDSLSPRDPVEFPVVLSAKTKKALRSNARQLAEFLNSTSDENAGSARIVAYSIGKRQNIDFYHRAAFSASDLAGVVSGLQRIASEGGPDEEDSSSSSRKQTKPARRPVVLCFGPQTGFSVPLPDDLLDQGMNTFGKHLDDCSYICKQHLGIAIESAVSETSTEGKRSTPKDGDVDLVTQHCCQFSIQYAAGRAWLDSGLEVDTAVGFSFGQFAAMCISGRLTLADALIAVAGRARLLRDDWVGDTGAMIAVECDEEDLEETRKDMQQVDGLGVDIACYIHSRSWTIAGDSASLQAFRRACHRQGEKRGTMKWIKMVDLKMTHAYHSRLADCIVPGLESLGHSITILPSKNQVMRLEVTHSCDGVASGSAQDFVDLTRRPCHWAQAIQRIAARHPEGVTWLEAGSATTVINMARQALHGLPKRPHDLWIPINLSNWSYQLSEAACKLWENGYSNAIYFWPFHEPHTKTSPTLDFPPYAFEKTRHWIQYKPSNIPTSGRSDEASRPVPQSDQLVTVDRHYQNLTLFRVNTDHHIFLELIKGHVVGGLPISPASLYIHLALACAGSAFPDEINWGISHLTMLNPLGTSHEAELLCSLGASHDDLQAAHNANLSFDFYIFSNQEPHRTTTLSSPTRKTYAQGRVIRSQDKDGAVQVVCSRPPVTTLISQVESLFKAAEGHLGPFSWFAASSGVLGTASVYGMFERVARYAEFYRGIKSVVLLRPDGFPPTGGKENGFPSRTREQNGSCILRDTQHVAMAVVEMPKQLPYSLTGVSDMILLDNFIQVAGIQINCIQSSLPGSPSESSHEYRSNYVYMCTNIDEIVWGTGLDPQQRRPWTVYTNFQHENNNRHESTATYDIIVYRGDCVGPHHDDARVAAVIVGASFRRVHRKTLGRLMSKETKERIDINTESEKVATASDEKDKNKDHKGADRSISSRVLDLLVDLLRVPVSHIQPHTTFDQLGVDSLLATELMAEIKNRFGVSWSAVDFQEFEDVGELCQHLQKAMCPGVCKQMHRSSFMPDEMPAKDSDFSSHQSNNMASPNDTEQDVQCLVQRMLSNVLGIPCTDLRRETTFDELGVDSLVATEVLSEIHKSFGIQWTAMDFQEFDDVGDLSDRIRVSLKLGPSDRATVKNKDDGSKANGGRGTVGSPPAETSPLSLIYVDCLRHLNCQAHVQDGRIAHTEIAALESELVSKYIIHALATLDARRCDLVHMDPGREVPVVAHHASVTAFIQRLYEHLKVDGLLFRENNRWRRSVKYVAADDEELQDGQNPLYLNPDWRVESQRFPKPYRQQIMLLHGLLYDGLASFLKTASGIKSANTDRIVDLRHQVNLLYENSAEIKAARLMIAQCLEAVLQKLVVGGHGLVKPFRVLEIGTDTGEIVRNLVEMLETNLRRHNNDIDDKGPVLGIQWAIAHRQDLSPGQTPQAKKIENEALCRLSEVELELISLDLEQNNKSDQIQYAGTFDVIIVTDSRKWDDSQQLNSATSMMCNMLRKDMGVIFLVEPSKSRSLSFFDVCQALTESDHLTAKPATIEEAVTWEQSLRQNGLNSTTRFQLGQHSSFLVASANRNQEIQPARGLGEGDQNMEPPQLCESETVAFKEAQGVTLYADIFYPKTAQAPGSKPRPVALMIHGGGHVFYTRKDVRPDQRDLLLDLGFLPLTIDYRKCPETTLIDGPMADVASALAWARQGLPGRLERPDVQVDGAKVVTIGWSTGGHLALSLAWTHGAGVAPPEGILGFYCATDYEDECFRQPLKPVGSELSAHKYADYQLTDDIWDNGLFDKPVAGYYFATNRSLVWRRTDPRARLVLHMNWHGTTLDILLNGMDKHARPRVAPPRANIAQIRAVSPLAQLQDGCYRSPTFLVHAGADDHIPVEQAERMHRALRDSGIPTGLRVVQGAIHAFDAYPGFAANQDAVAAVEDGYAFLCECVGLTWDKKRVEFRPIAPRVGFKG